MCSPRNPNICLDCEALTLDDSPLMLARQTEAESAPQETGRATTSVLKREMPQQSTAPIAEPHPI